MVRFATVAPAQVSPNAFAFATPYTGGNVTVFYNRVQRAAGWTDTSVLLAYVMVHEIAHVLERSDHHSSFGVMKAEWTNMDYLEMANRSLGFAEEDVRLLQQSGGPGGPLARLTAAH